MNFEDKLWIEKWIQEPFSPISETYVCAGYGTDKEPDGSLCMASFAFSMGDNFKEGMKLLDYGCGSARFCNFISKRLKNFTYYGLEPDSPFGNEGIEIAKNHFGYDQRVKFGFIGTDLEKEAINNVDTVLLLSIFTHTTIEETEQILRKLFPIIERGGKVVFSMILGSRYRPLGKGAYTMPESIDVVYNTTQQIKVLKQKLSCNMNFVDSFLAGDYLHSIYEVVK